MLVGSFGYLPVGLSGDFSGQAETSWDRTEQPLVVICWQLLGKLRPLCQAQPAAFGAADVASLLRVLRCSCEVYAQDTSAEACSTSYFDDTVSPARKAPVDWQDAQICVLFLLTSWIASTAKVGAQSLADASCVFTSTLGDMNEYRNFYTGVEAKLPKSTQT